MTNSADTLAGERGTWCMLAALPGFVASAGIFCGRFVARHAGLLARRLVLPAAVGWATLYLLLWGYCDTLLAFLEHPNGSGASRVLGISAIGLLAMLFLHAIIVAIVADMAAHRTNTAWSVGRIGAFAWRIYATNLRLVMLAGVSVLLSMLAIRFFAIPPGVSSILWAVVLVLAFWLLARAWFFVAPVCMTGPETGALQTAWRKSCGRFMPIAALMIACAGIWLAVQLGGEIVLRASGILQDLREHMDFSLMTRVYRDELLPVTLLFSFSYLVVTVCMTAMRVYAYRCLTGTDDFASP